MFALAAKANIPRRHLDALLPIFLPIIVIIRANPQPPFVEEPVVSAEASDKESTVSAGVVCTALTSSARYGEGLRTCNRWAKASPSFAATIEIEPTFPSSPNRRRARLPSAQTRPCSGA